MPPEPPAAVKASDGTEGMKRSGVRLSLKKEEPAPKPAEPAPAPAPAPTPATEAPKAAEPPASPAPAAEPPAAPKAAPVFKKINLATPAEKAAKTPAFAPAAPAPVASSAEPVKPALAHNEPKFDIPKAAPVMKEPEPTAASYAISAVVALLFVGVAFAVVAFLL